MSNKLVAYFSASGTTRLVAEKISQLVQADLFEICPETPYTQADLDWTNKTSRSSIEMKDQQSRPKIKDKVHQMDQYDQIFLGFPIWWYQAPTIINSFLEQYDLKGKIIIPFATSGGSGMGKTNQYLQPSCQKSILKEGRRWSSQASQDELTSWLKSVLEMDH